MRHLLNILVTLALTVCSWGTVCLALEAVGVMRLLNIPFHGTMIAGVTISFVGGIVYWFMSKDIAAWSLNFRALAAADLSKATCPDLGELLPELAQSVGLKKVPELLLFTAPEATALAVGFRRDKTVVAVSTGLLQTLSTADARVILLQTLAKVANGDVSALLLAQGFVNVFTLFPARVFAAQMGTSLRTQEEDTPSDTPERIIIAVLETLLAPLPALFIRHMARAADLRADRTAAGQCGKPQMQHILGVLSQSKTPSAFRERFTESVKFGALARAALRPFSFHVPYESRVAKLA